MNPFLQLLAVTSLALTAAVDGAVTLHVAPSGDADGTGTPESPYRTLEQARDAIRAHVSTRGRPAGGFVVELAPGSYPLPRGIAFGAADSGTPEAPIVYRARERGTAVLTGGVHLSGWQPVTDQATVALLAPEAIGNVVWTTIPPSVPEAVPGFANGGCGFKGQREYPLALFQSGARLPIARWPNDGYTTMGECLGANHVAGHVGVTYTDGVFRFDDRQRLERWTREPDLWFDGLWFHHWADQKMRLKAIDLNAGTISLESPETHAFGFKKGQGFYAFNAIGEIDRPGEWAVDRAARRLYLWAATVPAAAPVVLAAQDVLLRIDGAEHLRFEDLTLEHCRRSAIVCRNSNGVQVTGSTIRHTGQWGVEIDGGSDCSVFGCDLYDLGEGGVLAAGGTRNTLKPANHVIENNHIHHFGQIVATYMPGAAVRGVGNRIRHNLIHHAQHQAIAFSGNDHLIENNIVHDVCLHSSDAGGIYACTRDWSQRGTVIRNNLFHALGKGLDGAGCRAIYLDDMTSGTVVEQNIVTMSDCGLNFGGGKDNVIQDNMALNCVTSLTLASRGIDSFAKVDAARGRESSCYQKLLKDEPLFRSELWQKRYPALLSILDMDPIDAQNAHGNVIRRNVNVGGGKLTVNNSAKVLRTCTVEENIDLYEDPGFVDLAQHDLRLRPDALARKRVPGFNAPDFARMGLYADARRASAPVKFGKDATPMPVIQPRIPQPELKPRYVLELLHDKPFQADGTANPDEWPKTSKAALECRNRIHKDPSKFPCTVRLGFDGQNLRVLATVATDPNAPLKTDGNWGGRDGIEIALSGPEENARVTLVHVYPDGTFERIAPGGPATPRQTEPLPEIRCGALRENDGWTAELAIPVALLGLDPAAFSQVRFNLNVRRTCDDTWTCWWPPQRGIDDLESSGLLILPRSVPETEEMSRRREAAKPLFAAEARGELDWRRLPGWPASADPDRLGPAALPDDAPAMSFGQASGWAVARQTLELTAAQLDQPVCALFFPCVDEEGEVYVNGTLAVSHTAAATGTSPGLLWNEPFLVDLKQAGAAPGKVEVAVHFRGNMGTGGIRKGVFLLWAKSPVTPQQCYDFLAEHPKLSGADRVPPFWQDFERERIPPIPPTPDETGFGKRIQRTMDLLANSSPQRRNRVRIFFYGQSITQGMHSREMINVLRRRFPWAIIEFENRAIGGFGASALVRTAEHDLYPRDADLLVFHVYGDAQSLDTLFSNVRRRNSSDILVYTHHYNWVSDPDGLASTLARLETSVRDWYALAEKYRMELAPVFRDWGTYLRTHDMGVNEVMGDTVHSNVHHNTAGHTLLAKLVLRNFRHHPDNPVPFPDVLQNVAAIAPAVSRTGAWEVRADGVRATEKGSRIALAFEGTRVDILPLPCARPGSAALLIDGQSPAQHPGLFACSLPSTGPYIWMPAIRRVELGREVLPQPESWTLTPFDADVAKGVFSFRLEGSVTGPDGEGRHDSNFISNSGRIAIDKSDFHIIWPCTYRKKDRLPDNYQVTWNVYPLFSDPWRPPANVDPTHHAPQTVIRGLPNGRHTLELIANGDGELGIRAFEVRKPTLE